MSEKAKATEPAKAIFDQSKVDWVSFFDHITKALQELTAGTATSFDDMLVGPLVDGLRDLLIGKLPPIKVTANVSSIPLTVDEVQERAKAMGLNLSPMVIKLIMALGRAFFEAFFTK
jgi:hypothetical protein